MAVNAKQYKTEKRKANVGERILITNAKISYDCYKNGDVFTVGGYYEDSMRQAVKSTVPGMISINHDEYEVIVANKPSKNERISLLETQVGELTAKVEALEKSKYEPKFYYDGKPLGKTQEIRILTQNQQRKAVIERAKAFVAETQRKMVDNNFTSEGNEFLSYWMTKVEFVVNAEKRTVVAIMRNYKTNAILTKAIAKCAPDDVFNADIGKAIALGRALGLDVSEFENAVKPTEVVVGHRIRMTYSCSEKTYDVGVKFFEDNEVRYVEGGFDMRKDVDNEATITDDTNAEYV